MDNKENDKDYKIQTLELISILQKIDSEIYKGKEASKLWGTPEGNPVAITHLSRAEYFTKLYKWPSELKENINKLLEWLEKYRQTLQTYDVTYSSMYKTRLEKAFSDLENLVFGRILES